MIKNTGDLIIDMVDIDFPPRFAITFMGFHINQGEEGTFIVTVNPLLMEKWKFFTRCLITTEEKDAEKIKNDKIKFYIIGEVL